MLYAFRKKILSYNFNSRSMTVAKELESQASVLAGNISTFQQNPFDSSIIQFLVGTDLKDKALAKFCLITYNTTDYNNLAKSREETV